MIREGAIFIRTVAWSFGFIGVQFALMGVLRASGNTFAAMLISLVSQWVLQFPLAFILSEHTALHPTACGGRSPSRTLLPHDRGDLVRTGRLEKTPPRCAHRTGSRRTGTWRRTC